VRWFEDNPLIKIGAIIFFLGAVWFVSYAIDQNWLSPIARIALGLLLAAGVMGVGAWRERFDTTQYQVLTVLGAAIGFGTVVASQFVFAYPLLPAPLAGGILIAVVAYVVGVAYRTKTEWLAVAAAVAGLLVPLLTNSADPSAVLLLGYLLLLSIGLLGVVFFTAWRHVTLVLLIGTTLYTLSAAAAPAVTDGVVWVFVLLFTSLFYASVMVSLLRANRAVILDVVSLGLIVFQYIGFAVWLALVPSIALFLAALVVATVGYVARQQARHVDIVSLLALVSLVLILVGTVELFDGYVLTIVLALEAVLVTVGSLYVATVKRSVYVATAMFALPVLFGLSDMETIMSLDSLSLPHVLGLVVVYGALSGVAVWMLEHPVLRPLPWLHTVAGVLLGTGFWFGIVASMTVINVTASTAADVPWRVVCYGALALVTILYCALRGPGPRWRQLPLFALLPVGLLIPDLLSATAWRTGIGHAHFAAALGLLGLLALLVLLYVWLSRRARLDESDPLNAYVLLWGAIGYAFFFIATVAGALLSGVSETVVTYVGQALTLYGVCVIMLYLRVRFVWVTWIAGLFVWPLLLSLASFAGWAGWSSLLAVEAVGVYTLTTLTLLFGLHLVSYVPEASGLILMRWVRQVSFGVSGGLAFATVWMVMHTLATGAVAVMAALFVYTVVGLVCYQYGRSAGRPDIRRAGMLLLGAVVLRLGLIDVWDMELLWRIMTFMGIGALFIVTALVERTQPPGSEAVE
jgi:uncharacterized membrane protein